MFVCLFVCKLQLVSADIGIQIATLTLINHLLCLLEQLHSPVALKDPAPKKSLLSFFLHSQN
jgi:hypothetical protein